MAAAQPNTKGPNYKTMEFDMEAAGKHPKEPQNGGQSKESVAGGSKESVGGPSKEYVGLNSSAEKKKDLDPAPKTVPPPKSFAAVPTNRNNPPPQNVDFSQPAPNTKEPAPIQVMPAPAPSNQGVSLLAISMLVHGLALAFLFANIMELMPGLGFFASYNLRCSYMRQDLQKAADRGRGSGLLSDREEWMCRYKYVKDPGAVITGALFIIVSFVALVVRTASLLLPVLSQRIKGKVGVLVSLGLVASVAIGGLLITIGGTFYLGCTADMNCPTTLAQQVNMGLLGLGGGYETRYLEGSPTAGDFTLPPKVTVWFAFITLVVAVMVEFLRMKRAQVEADPVIQYKPANAAPTRPGSMPTDSGSS